MVQLKDQHSRFRAAKAARIRDGSHAFALYEIGEHAEQESVHHLTEPGKMTRIDAMDHAELVIRSQDMKFRAKIQVNDALYGPYLKIM